MSSTPPPQHPTASVILSAAKNLFAHSTNRFPRSAATHLELQTPLLQNRSFCQGIGEGPFVGAATA
jgi:hypothetical protein